MFHVAALVDVGRRVDGLDRDAGARLELGLAPGGDLVRVAGQPLLLARSDLGGL